MRKRGSAAEPPGEHETYLRPAKTPRDRADSCDPLPRTRPVSGSRAESCFRQLIDRSHRAEQMKKRVVLVNELAINRESARREIGHCRAKFVQLVSGDRLGPIVEFLQQCAGERDFECALRNGQQSELLRDDLALLRDLDATVHCPGRHCSECARYRRASPTTDTSTAAMKETQLNACISEHFGECFLRLIERPR